MTKSFHEILTERCLHTLMDNPYVQMVISHDKLMEFVRFCIVGGTSAVIDAIIYYTALSILPDGSLQFSGFSVFSYQIAVLCGYLLSLCVNYYLTVTWTFKVSASKKNAVGIVAAHMFNLFVVRMGLMWVLVTTLQISENIAYLPMAVISAFTNFIVVRFVVNLTSRGN